MKNKVLSVARDIVISAAALIFIETVLMGETWRMATGSTVNYLGGFIAALAFFRKEIFHSTAVSKTEYDRAVASIEYWRNQ